MHGCMGAVNKGVRAEGGQIIGISHELFRGGDHRIEDKIVCVLHMLTFKNNQYLGLYRR